MQSEIAQGRYHRAVPYLLERGRVAEAARLEALRGNTDEAAKLYERAGDTRGAASVYMTMADYEMAALVFKEGGLQPEAAEAFAQAGRYDTASGIFEELGLWERALAAASHLDDIERQAGILARMGDDDASGRLLAEAAEKQGNWEEAAKRWEQAGKHQRAATAWREAGDPAKAGKLLVEMGDLQGAASLLVKAGDFNMAAEVFVRLGRFTEAGHAYHRAGDLGKAVELFKEDENWVTLARLYHHHDRDSQALAVLENVDTESTDWEEAQVLTAELLKGHGKAQDAYRVYEELVKRRVATKNVDASVRRWMVAMAELLFRHGKNEEAVKCLEHLRELGLMTDELETKLEELQRRGGSNELLAAATGALGMPLHARYDFIDKIGEGGNGVIYRAQDKMLGRVIAIKMIGQTALPSDIAKKFFMREAQTAAALNHPGIVTIYDLGELDGLMYIAMELIEGESLADKLAAAKGIMPAFSVIPLIAQLCGALEYAHDKGVIHRDVKLENVMVTTDGDVKLMDFGLAKALQETPDKSLVITGTPLYMSPEQIMGGQADHRTDLYALGVMVFRLLTGQWPFFDGNILEMHREAPVPDPCEINPELPAGFTAIMQKTMAKLPDDRYSSAGEVSAALLEAFGMVAP